TELIHLVLILFFIFILKLLLFSYFCGNINVSIIINKRLILGGKRVNKAQVVEIKHRLMPILKSKENKYKNMGYKDISTEDNWDCLWNQIWKSKQEFTLHQIVQDILHLPIQTYMSYLSLSAYHRDNNDLMKSIQAVTNNEIK